MTTIFRYYDARNNAKNGGAACLIGINALDADSSKRTNAIKIHITNFFTLTKL